MFVNVSTTRIKIHASEIRQRFIELMRFYLEMSLRLDSTLERTYFVVRKNGFEPKEWIKKRYYDLSQINSCSYKCGFLDVNQRVRLLDAEHE